MITINTKEPAIRGTEGGKYECPNCYWTEIRQKYFYCPMCGQRIEWKEEK